MCGGGTTYETLRYGWDCGVTHFLSILAKAMPINNCLNHDLPGMDLSASSLLEL